MQRPSRIFIDIHHAIRVAIEDYPWWLRPIGYVGWWISLTPKFPFIVLYAFDYPDEDDQHYPDHTGDGWRN